MNALFMTCLKSLTLVVLASATTWGYADITRLNTLSNEELAAVYGQYSIDSKEHQSLRDKLDLSDVATLDLVLLFQRDQAAGEQVLELLAALQKDVDVKTATDDIYTLLSTETDASLIAARQELMALLGTDTQPTLNDLLTGFFIKPGTAISPENLQLPQLPITEQAE